MRVTFFVFGVLISLTIAAPAAASTDPACQREPDAVSVLLAMTAPTGLQEPALAPVRQSAVVWFHRPVRVGDRILLGRYVIEHDNDRMARGLPCTHIYESSGARLPVVAFHCAHLTREPATRNTVVLRPFSGDLGTSVLTEFQFAGETASHGVPSTRRR